MKIYRAKKNSTALLTGMMLFILTGSIFGQNMFRKVNDFDGDGKADYAVTRNVGGQKYWYIWKSASGPNVFQFGLDTDIETAGDWNNDGKTDISVYRKFGSSCNPTCQTENYNWWNLLSTSNTVEGRAMWDAPGVATFSHAQDYVGDGKMDPAVIFNRTAAQGIPFLRHYGVNFDLVEKQFNNGEIPVRLGDLTGDGKADLVTIDANNVVTIRNSATNALQSIQFGTTGDEYVPADFDGDGKGDLAVFRQSNGSWWWIRSSDNVVQAVQFGAIGDKPVPADYDGDGKTDLAIWRPGASQSVYWVYGSMGNIWAVEFGIPTDTVVRY